MGGPTLEGGLRQFQERPHGELDQGQGGTEEGHTRVAPSLRGKEEEVQRGSKRFKVGRTEKLGVTKGGSREGASSRAGHLGMKQTLGW